ncbi:MAG: DUF2946 family protein [Xanthobacteraceae bacterium]
MFRLRQFVRSRSSGRLLALWIAYSVAIQALMASVGLGMSAFAADGSVGFAICSHAAGLPTPSGHQNPKPSRHCPFCFVASQSAGYIPLVAEAPPLPVYAGRPIAPVMDRIGDKGHVAQFRRMTGAPRAPPVFSV